MAPIIGIGWFDNPRLKLVNGSHIKVRVDEGNSVEIPEHSLDSYLLIWTADSLAEVTGKEYGAGGFSSIGTYSEPRALEVAGVPGKVRISLSLLVGDVLSGRVLEVAVRAWSAYIWRTRAAYIWRTRGGPTILSADISVGWQVCVSLH